MRIPIRPPDRRVTALLLVGLAGSAGCVGDLPPGADASPFPDPPPPPPGVIDDAGIQPPVCRDIELLHNSTFDDRPLAAGWTAASTTATDVLISDAVGPDAPMAHTPRHKAYFGGIDGVFETLSQDVAVPAGTTQLVLTGQRHVYTIESGTAVTDQVWVELVGPAGVGEELARWSNRDVTDDWTPFSAPVTVPLTAQVLRLRFGAFTDGQRWSSFLFDSLALTATTCQ